VQRRCNRLGGSGKRLLLRVAKEALELAHVFVAKPRQHQEHRENEQQLGADAERDAHGRSVRR